MRWSQITLALGAALFMSACWEDVSFPEELQRSIPEKARGEDYLNLNGKSLKDFEGSSHHGDEGHEETPAE